MLLVAAIVLFLVLPSPWNAVALAGLLALEILELLFWRWTVKGRRVQAGAEALVGMRARVLSTCRPDGEVWVEGARWKARCVAGADPDELVTVTGREGLVLIVEP